MLIGAHAGREHLAQFFATRQSEAVRRVTVLFQLRGQGAAARRLPWQVQLARHLRPGGLGKSRPVYRRVGLGRLRVEQLTVFDKQQAMHHQRWHVAELRIQLCRVVELIQRRGAAIGDAQPGLDFFCVGNKQTVTAVVHQRRGEACLGLDHVITLEKARQEVAQGAVAQALIEGPCAGVQDRIAGSGFDAVGQLRGPLAEGASLPASAVHLAQHGKTQGEQHQQQDQPEQPAPWPRRSEFFRQWGG